MGCPQVFLFPKMLVDYALDEEQKADGIDNQTSDTATASTTYLESAEIKGEMVLADYFAGYLWRHLCLVSECGQDATLCRAIQ